MREIPLSQGKSAIVDDEDYEWLMHWKWYTYNSRNTWYAIRKETPPRVNGKKVWVYIAMHRFILNAPRDMQVDHVNSNGLDNRRCNIRLATHSQNCVNRGANKNNLTGYKGVHRRKENGRYQAYIRRDNRTIGLGGYTTAEEAALAYNAAAVEQYGEFARLNIIGEEHE